MSHDTSTLVGVLVVLHIVSLIRCLSKKMKIRYLYALNGSRYVHQYNYYVSLFNCSFRNMSMRVWIIHITMCLILSAKQNVIGLCLFPFVMYTFPDN